MLLPEFTLIAFTSAVEPLRMANRLSAEPLYEWQVLTVTGEATDVSSNGPIDSLHNAAAFGHADANNAPFVIEIFIEMEKEHHIPLFQQEHARPPEVQHI